MPESAVAALRHDFDRCALPPRKRAMKSKERRAGAAPSRGAVDLIENRATHEQWLQLRSSFDGAPGGGLMKSGGASNTRSWQILAAISRLVSLTGCLERVHKICRSCFVPFMFLG